MVGKCLIVDNMHESIFSMLRDIGWEPDYRPEIDRKTIKEIAGKYDGLIVRSKTTIDADLLGPNPSVRFIGRAGAGLDNLDLPYLRSKSIAVVHASEGNRDAVGEYTVGALLALMRNLPRADREVRAYEWEREGNRGEEIMGKTVSVIGFGNMGRAFSARLRGFDCTILAYDKYKKQYEVPYVTGAGMEEVFAESDILSLHIPLTAETRNMVGDSYFNSFRKPIIFVNTARGEIVSLAALRRAMEAGKVRGAVLDVLENEKLSTLSAEQREAFDFLKESSNVILTPHIAGWTFESHVKINVALVSKISQLSVTG